MGRPECQNGSCICNPTRNYPLEYYFCLEVVKSKLHVTEKGDNKTKAWEKFAGTFFAMDSFKTFKPIGGQSFLKKFETIVTAMAPIFMNDKGFDAHQFDKSTKTRGNRIKVI